MTSKTSDQSLESGTRAGGADGSLGAELRRAREARGVTLREISEQSRITMRHLEAIEADDYKHLPGGIFNKSFIKAYARHIRFDEQRALDLYARTLRERGETDEEAATSPRRSQVYTDSDAARSPFITALLSAVIIGVIVLLVYVGYNWYRGPQNKQADAPAPASDAKPGGQASAQPTPPPAPASDFSVQVKARGEDVWMSARVDEEKQSEATLKPEEARQFTPQTGVAIRYSKSKVGKVEVTINGQVAQAPPPNAKSGLVEWTITKENFRQFLP